MAKARSSGLLHQVSTLFGAGVAGGLSDAELLDRFLSRNAAAEDAALAAEAAFAACTKHRLCHCFTPDPPALPPVRFHWDRENGSGGRRENRKSVW